MRMRGKKCSGGKHSKLRLTGLTAGNALGKKLHLFIKGKSQKPECFKHIKTFPSRYKGQKKSWMNGELFEEWAKEVDERFQREGRNIAMIMDNCSAHPNVEGLKAIELKLLPANTTSNTQPMDQGIIRSVKAKYRHLSARRIIRYLDSGMPLLTTSILDDMIMLVKAWNAVEEKTIVICFWKARISPESPFHPDLVPDDANTEQLVYVDAEVETSGPALTEVETSGPALTEVETSGPALTEVETSGPALTEVETSGPALTEVETSGPVTYRSGDKWLCTYRSGDKWPCTY